MKRTSAVLFLIFQVLLHTGVVSTAGRGAQAKVKPKDAQEFLQYEVAVTAKLVQVHVTDHKGNPVRDLEMPDFVLYDNGQLQAITGFEKHFLAAPEAKVEEGKLSPARDVASLMNRKFVFLFDGERNDNAGLAMSRKAALQFMDDQVQPTDEIALMSYSPIQGLVLHEYFTSDHKKVREAIIKAKVPPGISAKGETTVPPGHEVMGTELLSQQIFGGHGHAPRPGGTRAFIFGLTDLAKAFRHIPGQKNIILFTKGFGRAILDPGSTNKPFFVSMSQELASANSPVFTVNTAEGMEKMAPPETSLEYLSKQTGGKYFDNLNYYSKNAADIQNTTANYYVLSYSVPSSWDGKYHDIKVEVKKPGYQVYAQRGYFNPLPFNKLSPTEKQLQLLDLALGEKAYFEQHLNFPMIALPFSDSREANTLLISEIPVQRLRQTVGDKTEFIILVFDADRNLVDSKRVEMNWSTIKGERICQYGAASLSPGQYDCRIVIRNLDSGKAAVGACAVEVPEKAADTGLKLYPPLLLIPGRSAPFLNVSGEKKTGVAQGVEISDIYPYPQQEFSPLLGGLERGTESLCAAVRCAWTGAGAPDVQFSAWLVPEGSGQKTGLTANLLGVANQDQARVFLLEFELPELQPGGYSLHIRAENPDTGASCETCSGISIVGPAGPVN
jgi:VWFA-related protein